jgi:hypothetical protein
MTWEMWFFAIAIPTWLAVMVGALYLDAKLGGWRSLAERYPCPSKQPLGGQTWWAETVILANGGSEYRGFVSITANQVGMTIRMPVMLRWLYPNIFLPWKDATVIRERGWLWDEVHLTFATVPDVRVTIRATLADKILAAVGPVWIESKVIERQPAKVA